LPPSSLSPARRVAFDVLCRVEEGAYASDELLTEAAQLTSRDAGLAGQIVFGCLRFQGQLDFLVEHYSKRAPGQLEPALLIALRMGIFQLRYLDRIPPHAAVHEMVELVKQGKRAAAGLTNAVLRKVDREPLRWPGKSIELSCPRWLLRKWTARYGAAEAEGIARAALQEPDHYIRIAPGTTLSAEDGLKLEPTPVSGCYRVVEGAAHDLRRRGLRFQDIGSQAIISLLQLEPDLSYLDLCAAPGNKTRQALETLLHAVACDSSEKRLRQVADICPRVVLDATKPLPFECRFQRILVDAPCSGTGTLARNPEIKWRVQSKYLPLQQSRQRLILQNALDRLAPGGLLLYATCSLETEENEEVTHWAVENFEGVRLVEETWRIPGRDPGDGFYAAVLRSERSGNI
jgi:16S rRNA (cytosine967-C5)-methyltransferase